MRSRITFLVLFLFVALLSADSNRAVQGSAALPFNQISTPAPGITCDQLVTLAETSVSLVCSGIGRNQACYGNHLVSVDFQPNSNLTFQQSGDRVDLLQVKRLSTSPLNALTRDWGIAVIKAQANLPDALPGQNVTFLLYGDTTVDNPSPAMNTVVVSTRLGSTSCTGVPDSAVLIQAPSGSQVAMKINGADVTLGSTAYITAEVGKEFTFAIVEGSGVVASNGITRTIPPGAQVRIPLGGADGLTADDAPSDLEPFNLAAIQLAPLKLLDRRVTIPLPFVPGQVAPSTDTPTPAATEAAATEVATSEACVPRTDWPYRYVIQKGDTLYTIAGKLNMPSADLQAGDCIVDPIRLIAGRSIRVPRPVATPVPPTPTPKPTVQVSNAFTGPNLRADKTSLYAPGDCTYIRWDLDNIDSVYFENDAAIGHDARQVCPSYTTTYTLVVVAHDGTRTPFQITIAIEGS